ncbi:MAG: nuclear transport factor 2 family protein [Gemmatimonadota bacterium]
MKSGTFWGAIAVVASLAATAGCRLASTPETSTDGMSELQAEIQAMMQDGARAFNEGRLDAFMSDYYESPSTTYIGGRGLVRGYDEIRERYLPWFEPGAERDSLSFENLEARRLGAMYSLVTGRWLIHAGDEVAATGPFSLVLRRVEGGWRIIHDHSSTDTE